MRVEKTDEYATWIDSLKDPVGRARILVRVECLIAGNPAFIVPSAKGFRNSRSSWSRTYSCPVERLIASNPGLHRALGQGISELKIDVGPGYRVYYSQRGARLILLLMGGDKSSQQKDIQRALKIMERLKE